MKYKIACFRLLEESGTAEVEAESQEEAQEMAEDLDDDDIEWDRNGADVAQATEVQSVTPMGDDGDVEDD